MLNVLLHAAELFCFCLGIHVVVWRVFPVRNQSLRLGMIFSFGPFVLIGAYTLASRLAPLSFSPVGWSSWGLASLLHFAASGVYLNLFTAVTGFSPSIGILERVDQSMPHGLARSELVPPWFTDKNLSGTRRENLLATGLICESGGSLHLSPRGRLVAGVFLAFRRFLGLPDVAKG
jgi:hypothetical protein